MYTPLELATLILDGCHIDSSWRDLRFIIASLLVEQMLPRDFITYASAMLSSEEAQCVFEVLRPNLSVDT